MNSAIYPHSGALGKPSESAIMDEERRLTWLEANAARCRRIHPQAECHKRYRRNADQLRAAIKDKGTPHV